MELLICLVLLLWRLLYHGSSGVDTDGVSVKEGDSVPLNTGVQTNQQDIIIWYYKDIRIAEIARDQSKICTDVQCNKGTEKAFRDRLKLDHQTGSLTIANITNTHSGEYTLKIISSSNNREKILSISLQGSSGVETVRVLVMVGDSVTLNTGVQINQQDRIRWYYNGIRIAQITRDQSKICTDVQYNEDTERFRDRLKLDHQTGSLNITNTDSGECKLMISRGYSDIDEIFSVSVTGVSAAGRDEMKRKTVNEGELVTLDTSVERNPNDVMMWYFNEILIAEITGDQSKICTDVQCEERFRDRLKLDHQTGSLIITHTTNTHSGEYQLQINNSRFSVTKIFSVSVTAVPGSGLSSVVIGAICAAGVAVILLAAAGIYCYYRSKQKGNRRRRDDHPQENCVIEPVALKQKTEVPQADDYKEETTFNLKTECPNK